MSIQQIINSAYSQLKQSPLNGPKVLILDDFTTKFLTLTISQTQLLEDEFLLTVHIKNSLQLQQLDNTHIVIFVSNSQSNQIIIRSLLQQPKKFNSFSLYFTQQINEQSLAQLAAADVHQIVQSVQIIPCHFTPINKNCILSDDIISTLSSFNISSVVYQQQFTNFAKSITLKQSGKNQTKLVLLDRSFDLISPLIPGASFSAVTDQITHFTDKGMLYDTQLNYFQLSTLSKKLYTLDIFQSSDLRAEKALQCKENLPVLTPNINGKSLQKLLQSADENAQIQQEITNFSHITQQQQNSQNILLQITIQTQNFIMDRTFDQLKYIIDIYQKAIKKDLNLTYYCVNMLNLYKIYTTGNEFKNEKKRDQFVKKIHSFFDFLLMKNNSLGMEIDQIKQKMSTIFVQNYDFSEVENLAKLARNQDPRNFLKYPVPEHAVLAQKVDKNFNFYYYRPRIVSLAEAVFQEQGLPGFEQIGGNAFDQVVIYVKGGISLHEISCLGVFEWSFSGGESQIMRGISNGVIVISDFIKRWDDE